MLYTQHNKDERHSSLEKYTSHFIERVVCERELETKQNCNILTPTLMAISVVSSSFSRVAQPEAWGPSSLLGAGFLYRILSPTGLVSKLTDFLSSLSNIIVQCPLLLVGVTIALIQPIHVQVIILIFLDRMHLLFTEVHFLFWQPGRVVGQYITRVPFFKSLIWHNLGLNPGLPDHWRTLYPLDQWPSKFCN